MKPRSRRYIANKKSHAVFIGVKEMRKHLSDWQKDHINDFKTKVEMEEHWNSLAFPPPQVYRDNWPMVEMIK